LFRHSLRLIAFSWLALVFLVQIPAASAYNAAALSPAAIPGAGVASVAAADDTGASYLNKIFRDLGPANKNKDSAAVSNALPAPVEWFLIVFGTLLYGQIALIAILWILFTSDMVGIILGLLLLMIILAFLRARKPRPIVLFVLACLNFFLGTGITLVVAFTEGVPPVLISLIPLGALVWLAFRKIDFSSITSVKP
jgi:hypothetical protein